MRNKSIVITLALVASIFTSHPATASKDVVGSGSSFISNYLEACRISYAKATGNIITYSSLGSGAGRSQLNNKIIDFAGTDTPYNPGEAKPTGIVYVPFIAGPIGVIYRLDGYSKPIKLKKETLAKIFAGKIKKWNHKSIIADNTIKGVKPKIPATAIRIAYRADGSGTSQIFTEYLNAVAPTIWTKTGNKDFKSAYPGKLSFTSQAASGSHGVVMIARQMNGVITYAESSFAGGLKLALIENGAGKFTAPTSKAASQFLSDFEPLANGLIKANYNNKNPLSYNVSAFSYIVAFKESTPKNDAVKKFLFFAVTKCNKEAVATGYSPLVGPVLAIAKSKIAEVSSGG
jgi:phosphate transport system substrate-binding protein